MQITMHCQSHCHHRGGLLLDLCLEVHLRCAEGKSPCWLEAVYELPMCIGMHLQFVTLFLLRSSRLRHHGNATKLLGHFACVAFIMSFEGSSTCPKLLGRTSRRCMRRGLLACFLGTASGLPSGPFFHATHCCPTASPIWAPKRQQEDMTTQVKSSKFRQISSRLQVSLIVGVSGKFEEHL